MTPSILEALTVLLLVVVYAGFMFIPTYVAFYRNHDHRMIILVVNAFLGWTGIGWAGTMVWALTEEVGNTIVVRAAAE
jgi:hypothetical protein